MSTSRRDVGQLARHAAAPQGVNEALLDQVTPVDSAALRHLIGAALAPGVAMPERSTIDTRITELAEHVRQLLTTVKDETAPVRATCLAAFRLLHTARRPSPLTTHYLAWEYSRDLANTANALLILHADQVAAASRPNTGRGVGAPVPAADGNPASGLGVFTARPGLPPEAPREHP
ncbi:DUF6415 family natural product biosynthesis protein [Streptomyces sp. NPDC056983]|uniref:DUF6415 family natural product biosynthesis protein n=1 Tax=Streptomyces sp. NPDC056983 TaxID=3345987 RepID=UPI00363D4D25